MTISAYSVDKNKRVEVLQEDTYLVGGDLVVSVTPELVRVGLVEGIGRKQVHKAAVEIKVVDGEIQITFCK